MGENIGVDPVPDRLAEMNLVAKDWWLGDARLLPGEAGGSWCSLSISETGVVSSVTRGSRVFDRVSALVTKRGAHTANEFVSDHAVRVPYVVRCVASGLGRSDARQLRDFLVSLGPSRSAGVGRVRRGISVLLFS